MNHNLCSSVNIELFHWVLDSPVRSEEGSALFPMLLRKFIDNILRFSVTHANFALIDIRLFLPKPRTYWLLKHRRRRPLLYTCRMFEVSRRFSVAPS